MIKKTRNEKIFDIFNYAIMAVVVFITLYPLWYVLIASFSGANAVTKGEVLFTVKDFTLNAYKKVLETDNIGISYINTIIYAIAGTLVSMILTILGGYVLSKKNLIGRKFLTLFVMFTMWFSAGMMPNYILMRDLNLLDSRLGVILFGAVSTFYVILMRSFFESIPESMEESAKIDGASDFRILFSIYLPLSTASIMTISLYYFVARWNSYFWPMILINDETKIPLQVVLKKMLVEMSGLYENSGNIDLSTTSKETMVYATMVVAVAPMLCIYPFVQKFFVKGVMLGAVKG